MKSAEARRSAVGWYRAGARRISCTPAERRGCRASRTAACADPSRQGGRHPVGSRRTAPPPGGCRPDQPAASGAFCDTVRGSFGHAAIMRPIVGDRTTSFPARTIEIAARNDGTPRLAGPAFSPSSRIAAAGAEMVGLGLPPARAPRASGLHPGFPPDGRSPSIGNPAAAAPRVLSFRSRRRPGGLHSPAGAPRSHPRCGRRH